MCGIAGIFDPAGLIQSRPLNEFLEKMNRRLIHRGPDSGKVWLDTDSGIGFAHRRLSILDISEAASQPMVSQSGKGALTFNGEIYNFKEVKERLNKSKQISWKGHGDTEVLVEALDYWGLDRTLDMLEGMFAFAWWDSSKKSLHLVRDRFGEKPLFWCQIKGFIAFASEIKAFFDLPDWKSEPELSALAGYSVYGYVSAPLSGFKNVNKLLPAHVVSIEQGLSIHSHRYWTPPENRINHSISLDFSAKQLDDFIAKSVEKQLIADVPVGTFLSGGVDSALICAMIAKAGNERVDAFTVGFGDPAFDESDAATAYAKHLGIRHHVIPLNIDSKAEELLPVLDQFDEPLADASIFPTYLVSGIAKKFVSVVLTGEGGDELFGGYNRYRWALSRSNWRFRSRKEQLMHFFQPDAEAWDSVFKSSITHWNDYDALIPGFNAKEATFAGLTPLRSMMNYDRMFYLSDDLLYKVDQSSMLHSLETRIPLFSREIFNFAAALPDNFLINRTQNKRVLRHILRQYYPDRLIMNRKMGFSAPVGAWLRREWRPWAETLINESRHNDLFNSALIREEWRLFLQNLNRSPFRIWNALVLLNWFKKHF